MIVLSATSYAQNYPKKVILNNDTVWVFTPEQTLRLVEITLERNAFQELNDSLKLDLSRCEFTSGKKSEEINLLNQKNTIFIDFMDAQRRDTQRISKELNKNRRNFKIYRNLTLVFSGAVLTVFLLR